MSGINDPDATSSVDRAAAKRRHMPDDAPQTGQRVDLHVRDDGTRIWHEPTETCRYFECEPGVWHSLDPKALEALWLHIVNKLNEKPRWQSSDAADAAFEALGLTPPEPKEGGQ